MAKCTKDMTNLAACLNKNKKKNLDLSGAILTKANLKGANLIGADLSGADLSKAMLEEANLTGANLIGANLIGAKLGGAELTGAFYFSDTICPNGKKYGEKGNNCPSTD